MVVLITSITAMLHAKTQERQDASKTNMTTDREKAMVAKTHDQKGKTELYLPFPSPVFAHKIPHSSS
jgi:hypothetical protein